MNQYDSVLQRNRVGTEKANPVPPPEADLYRHSQSLPQNPEVNLEGWYAKTTPPQSAATTGIPAQIGGDASTTRAQPKL